MFRAGGEQREIPSRLMVPRFQQAIGAPSPPHDVNKFAVHHAAKECVVHATNLRKIRNRHQRISLDPGEMGQRVQVGSVEGRPGLPETALARELVRSRETGEFGKANDEAWEALSFQREGSDGKAAASLRAGKRRHGPTYANAPCCGWAQRAE